MKTVSKLFFILICLVFLSPIHVLATTYYMNLTNDNNTGTSGPWASVTLSDSLYNGMDAVHFVVDPIDSAFLNRGTNFGMQAFYFNENTGFGSLLRLANLDPSSWSYSYNPLHQNAGGDFGKFDILTSGTGSSRANPLSFDIYATNGASISIANFTTQLSTEDYMFAAHIADYNGGMSAKFASDGSVPVPEPGTMVLLGAGLFSLAVWHRRRANR